MARHPRRPSGRGAPDRLPPPIEPPDTVVEIDLPDKSAVPTLRLEKELWSKGLLRVVGVDEVGMAALAGPVVAAACLVTPDTKLIRRVKDSKMLTRAEREDLFELIRSRVAEHLNVRLAPGPITPMAKSYLER